MRAAQRTAGSAFTRLLVSNSLSSLGDGLHLVALPLLATSITSSPLVIGGVAAISSVPTLLGSLLVGSVVDRVPRGRLMIYVDVVRALLVLALVVILLYSDAAVWELLTLAFALGIGELIFDVSSAALVPEVMPDDALIKFNGYLSTVREFGNGLVGPALAGLLYGLFRSLPFLLNSASFIASAVLIVGIARKEKPMEHSGSALSPRKFRMEAVAGYRWLRSDRPMLALVVLVAAWSLFGWMPESTLVLYCTRSLGLAPFGYGVLLSVTAAGAILGGLASSKIIARIGVQRVLSPSLFMYGVFITPAFFLHSPGAVGLFFFLQGIPVLIFSVASTTCRQRRVPRQLMGRVSSIFYLAGAGVAPFGLLLGGLFGSWFGVRSTFAIGGLGIIIVTAVTHRSLSGFTQEFTSVSTEA